MKFFDFGDRQKSEETIYRTWIYLRDSLKNKEFSYKDIDKAKSITFLRVFDSLFNQHSGFRYITKQIKDINRGIGRGTKLSPDEKVNFERFIPKKEYITHDNRFSPEGIEWLYLALDTDVAAIEVSKREIHTHLGDRFGFCSFAFDNKILENQIVDLTVADDISYDIINSNLEYYVQVISNQEIIKALFTIELPEKGNILKKEKFEQIFIRWTIYTYCKLLSEQIFLPLATDDKNIEYAPFHLIAQYFISMGYSGIIYKSTVCDKGKNIVLFNKEYAHPQGDIIDIIL